MARRSTRSRSAAAAPAPAPPPLWTSIRPELFTSLEQPRPVIFLSAPEPLNHPEPQPSRPNWTKSALALGAMTVAAGAIANVSELAVVAPFDCAAQKGRPTGFDGLH